MDILPPDDPAPIALVMRVQEDGIDKDILVAALSVDAADEISAATGGTLVEADVDTAYEDVTAQWPRDREALEERYGAPAPGYR